MLILQRFYGDHAPFLRSGLISIIFVRASDCVNGALHYLIKQGIVKNCTCNVNQSILHTRHIQKGMITIQFLKDRPLSVVILGILV